MFTVVHHKCHFSGSEEDIKELKDKILDVDAEGKVFFNFNKVIKTPPELECVPWSLFGEAAVALLEADKEELVKDNAEYLHFVTNQAASEQEDYKTLTFGALIERLDGNEDLQHKFGVSLSLGRMYLKNFIKYGALHCVDWRKKNWGVEWGCFNAEVTCNDATRLDFGFIMHDGLPDEIYLKLCEDYPAIDMVFHYCYNDGDGVRYGTYENTITEEGEPQLIKIVRDDCLEGNPETIAFIEENFPEVAKSISNDLITDESENA